MSVFGEYAKKNLTQIVLVLESKGLEGDVTEDDMQRRHLAQHSIAMLEQCWNHSKQCRDNITTLCCAKKRCCDSSRVT